VKGKVFSVFIGFVVCEKAVAGAVHALDDFFDECGFTASGGADEEDVFGCRFVGHGFWICWGKIWDARDRNWKRELPGTGFPSWSLGTRIKKRRAAELVSFQGS